MNIMKIIRNVVLGIAVGLLVGHATFAATTGELLQQGLYAEEVEGNVDSAIKAYEQVIKDSAAPPNHMAQALFRRSMCYLKLKNEAAAREDLERLVADYPAQTDIVEKARPILDELSDFDPASLMPADTLAYIEMGSPGRQVETLLTMLKGTPFENPLAMVAGPWGNGSGQRSPGDIVGALLNPSMMAEFKKIRSSAVGITGIAENHPEMISVLYPGRSDALRGLILAALGMAGKPGEALEGMQTVNLPEDMAVAFDDRVIIMARPARRLDWSVRKYKGKSNEASLGTVKSSFSKITKSQRQQNVFTVWANVAGIYGKISQMFPEGKLPPQVVVANAFMDFNHIEDLVLTESVETNGLGSRMEIEFKDGHRSLAYDLIRTPAIDKGGLEAVPANAVGLISFALSPAISDQAERIRSQVHNVTGLDLGRELFSNIEQVTLFAMPVAADESKLFLPGHFGMAITSRNPEQTRQIIETVLGTANPGGPVQRTETSSHFKIKSGGSDKDCYVHQINGITVLSLDANLADAAVAALKNHSSICASGVLNASVNRLTPNTSKLILINAGGAIRILERLSKTDGFSDDQRQEFRASVEDLAKAADRTTVELRTDEQLNDFAVTSGVNGLPPLNAVIGPVMKISAIIKDARAQAIARSQRNERHGLIMPARNAPVIDGNPDVLWSTAPEYPLENQIKNFGSGEPVSLPLSPQDLSANFRALWDRENLYLLVDVTDDKLISDTDSDHPITVPTGSSTIPWWYDDSVEVYVSADHSRADTYGEHDLQLRINWSASKPTLRCYRNNTEIKLIGVEMAMVKTEQGYRTEIKLPWSAVAANPAGGSIIGLDVHVNDDDDGNARDSKITWHDTQDDAWQRPGSFGTADLAGLVGWWRFDETNGAAAMDSSGNRHNGSLAGTAKWAAGRNGGAVDLDGAGSFIQIADRSAFDFRNQMTVASWVNIRSVPMEWMAIVTKGDSAWRLSTARQENKIHFAVTNDWNSVFESAAPINANEWHHLAAVYNGESMKLFIDGKLNSTQPCPGGISGNDAEVLIGENAEKPNRCFNGRIDDVRIYNYALSEGEITAIATAE